MISGVLEREASLVLTKIARPFMTEKEGKQAQAIARLVSMMRKMVGAKDE